MALHFLGISVLLAFLSGYQGAEFVTPEQNVPDSAIGWHQDMGRILLFITIPVVALGMIYEKAENNKKFFQAAYYFFLILGFLMVLYTGYLGAELVFSHGAGVGVEVGG